MRFAVRRTSSRCEDEPPCEGAVRVFVDSWDQRTFKSVEEYDARMRHPWLSDGTDHGVNSVGIFRRRGQEVAWLFDIDDLADLAKFLARYGRCVVTPACKEANEQREFPTLEIYDTYRE